MIGMWVPSMVLPQLGNFFLIFAQNIDYGYTLGPPQRGGFNEKPGIIYVLEQKYAYPCKPQFRYIKVGIREYLFHRHVFLV